MSFKRSYLPDDERELIAEWRRWLITIYLAILIGVLAAVCIVQSLDVQ